ncbi:SigB/SigF/SigG family RNA polymerase sigma factor [Conexibacter sp. W3-3-2]|nr:SigB/SigF/SigG family RNA polymerase sigma factor [Conexibacter sp. W3-3-2]
MPLVHHVARRYQNRGEQYDDLVQAGAVGLVKAVDRFDPSRGISFTSFAVPNIAGEIRRHFRDKGNTVRLPRDIQERSAALHKAGQELEGTLQRPPTTAELAEAAGMTMAQVLDTLVAQQRQDVQSLDREIGEDASGHDRHGETETGYARVEDLEALRGGMRVLQERERRIVHLRFYDGLTQSEIAERVGISQMHVSRLLRQALKDMRRAMAEPQAPERVLREA